MNSFVRLLGVLFLLFIVGGCTPEERAAVGGLAAGAIIGSVLSDNDSSDQYHYRHACRGLSGVDLYQCRCNRFNDCSALRAYNEHRYHRHHTPCRYGYDRYGRCR